jgi:hypothetical protein
MKRMNDAAVSPVVGVMLMLVVTIIIAAVVSAFAGGLASDQSKAPQATLTSTPVIQGIEDTDKTNYEPDYPPGFKADNGLLFEHMGGDGFALGEIQIQLQSQDTTITLSNADTFAATNCTSPAVTAYLMEIGSSDGYIMPGDKFMLYADNCYDSTDGAWGPPQGKALSWRPANALGGKAAFLNTKNEYKIIDKASSKVIQSGFFVLR